MYHGAHYQGNDTDSGVLSAKRQHVTECTTGKKRPGLLDFNLPPVRKVPVLSSGVLVIKRLRK